jgi:hypothetical protein
MGKRKSTAEDKAGEMDVDGDSSDDVSHDDKRNIKKKSENTPNAQKYTNKPPSRTHP